MTTQVSDLRHRKHWSQVLLFLAGAKTWSLHFVICYALVSMGCAPPLGGWTMGGLNGASVSVSVTTIVGLLIALFATRRAHHHWRAGSARSDVDGSLMHFFAGLGILLNGFFAFTIVFEGIAALLLKPCT